MAVYKTIGAGQLLKRKGEIEGGEQVFSVGLPSLAWLEASTWAVTTSHLWLCGLANAIVPLRLCGHHGLKKWSI